MPPMAKTKVSIPLEDRDTVLVIGGGPAGAFFALRLLRRARLLGKHIELVIVERKRELQFYEPSCPHPPREGCAYCAGGISPKLADVLEEDGLILPEEIIQGRAESITLHGDWKAIELQIPEGRRMYSVFRGSRPKSDAAHGGNFDSYILGKAQDEGAEVVTGEVTEVSYSPGGRPVVSYRAAASGEERLEEREVDFVVFAGGVNHTPGRRLVEMPALVSLQKLIPGFRPPRVRKALIFEVHAADEDLRPIRGEVHFAQSGSKSLKIEMSSLIPKNKFITVSLLGRSVDVAAPADNMRIAMDFLALPHIRRILPRKISGMPLCACNPNMTVGAARRPYGNRIALIGDMAVSRLYKDGILSAYLTASALADCLLDAGIDKESLKRGYWPAVRRFSRDNTFGRFVFLFNQITFTSPILSRVLYQAMITERKTKPHLSRRLGRLLWNTASGDDTYGHILASMFHPSTLASIAVGGFLITARNVLTERVFGLKWAGFGRHPTGLRIEDFRARRREFLGALGPEAQDRPREFERMYTISIKGGAHATLARLGELGDKDRKYFTPRFLKVYRTVGKPNEIGSVIRYDSALSFLSFSIVLEKKIGERYLIYRVLDGFPRGGVLIFNVDPVREGVLHLSIYVAFDFHRPQNPIRRMAWRVFRALFPGFVHDVLWNHSLCKLKELVETE